MSLSPRVFRFGRPRLQGGWGLILALSLIGCQKPAEIRQYEVPKPPHRMLGAMIFLAEEAWFFKVTGPREELEQQSDKFQKFMQSVRFGDSGARVPTWDLPEGWKETGSSETRYQTIKFQAGDEECELAVSKLPMKTSQGNEFLLANLNRWRGQIELSPLLSDEVERETKKITLAEGTVATLVDLVGTLEPKPLPGKGPDMGMGRDMLAGPRPSLPADASPAAPPPKFQLPEGWSEGEPARFSKLTFEVRDGKEQVKITVTDLPAQSNPLIDNVNRWRGMMQLPPVELPELEKQMRLIKMGDVSGAYVELSTPAESQKPQALLGVVAYRGDQAWFVKLQGDKPLAAREKSRFEEFVQSLRF